jgi:hypothetical protein
MTSRSLALVLLLCGCGDGESIRRERFPRTATVERAGILDRGPREMAAHALSRVNGECEAGEIRACGLSTLPGPNGEPGGSPLFMHCIQDTGGRWFFHDEDCATPLVLAFDGAKVAFTRSAATFAVGPFDRTEWVAASSPWLALDRDGSGCIESARELFAGFSELAPFDDDGNGRIDAHDAVFSSLVLWADKNQDKRCSPDEIEPLAARAVVAIDLRFERPSGPRDRGSYEGERASVVTASGNARVVDVYLSPLP